MKLDIEIERSRVVDRRGPSLAEWRHRARLPLTRTFGWIGLAAVLTAACGLENAVATMGLERTQDAAPNRSASEAHSTLGGGDPLPIMITLRDRESGRETQFRCMSSSDRAPAEDLVVDANALADVAAALCGPKY